MNANLVIVAALDALEAGDVDLAREILLGAREDGPSERPYLCLPASSASSGLARAIATSSKFTATTEKPREAAPALFCGYVVENGVRRRLRQDELREAWRLWCRHSDIRRGKVKAA